MQLRGAASRERREGKRKGRGKGKGEGEGKTNFVIHLVAYAIAQQAVCFANQVFLMLLIAKNVLDFQFPLPAFVNLDLNDGVVDPLVQFINELIKKRGIKTLISIGQNEI